ncbi:spore coat associated protein CotJA [Bacillus sp. MUM 13]|uniref:spore coat associated protein CotJA n=1 Tax=Bacillus sp. MUM 13 TaxID=1678001 RepID=UPI0008F5861B|nr:spore coat associated protein CotJA [Bacillus sp. MUM 13]OIK09917.1 spore coat protein CotJA [Bacillus sp. MUM 13]
MDNTANYSFTPLKGYRPFHGLFDPCRPLGVKYYSTPPNLYLGFQPPNLQQYPANEALMKGTLWPALWDYYENPYKAKEGMGL